MLMGWKRLFVFIFATGLVLPPVCCLGTTLGSGPSHVPSAAQAGASPGAHSCCADHAVGRVTEQPAPVSCPSQHPTGTSCLDYGLGAAKAASPALPVTVDYAPAMAAIAWTQTKPILMMVQNNRMLHEDGGPPGRAEEQHGLQARLGVWLI